MKKLLSISVLSAGLALAMPAHGGNTNVALNSGGFSIGISGYVPVICRASVDATAVQPREGTISLGSLNEFCNNPTGYEVFADHSADMSTASLLVDGAKIPLSESGSTRISGASGAAIQAHSLALELPEGVAVGNISFRIVPL